MKKKGILFGVVGAFLLVASVEAQSTLCLSICNQYAPCDRACRQYSGGPWTTCGAWGDCQSGVCYPNWQAVSVTNLGSIEVNYYNPNQCEHRIVQNITWHDTHNCPGSSDYTTCSYFIDATRNDHLCCYIFGCGGQTSC